VKDSVGAIFRPIVNMAATIDGNPLNAYIEAVKQRTKKPPTFQPAAFNLSSTARWQYRFCDHRFIRRIESGLNISHFSTCRAGTRSKPHQRGRV
jgi:hypothetical protein